MGAVMAAFGTSHLSWIDIVLGGTAGVVVYVGALLALRAITVAELRAFRAAVGGKLGGGRRRAAA
jgi:threonine aldolase